MRETLYTAVGSFGLQSAEQQLQKAWRELARCRAATEENDRRDAAINCAVAIWHINDWLWASITQGKADRPEIAKLLGVTHRKLEQSDLVKWAVAECPELNLMQSVCNASKHVAAVGITSTKSDATTQGANVARLVIIDGCVEHDALKVFENAIDFWVDQATNSYILH